jgi:predicted NAD/FAD-binding protein
LNICGKRHTHFAGAYWYSGFHEDGVKSALDVAKRFGCYLAQQEPASNEID